MAGILAGFGEGGDIDTDCLHGSQLKRNACGRIVAECTRGQVSLASGKKMNKMLGFSWRKSR
jgi:hypothetical protein